MGAIISPASELDDSDEWKLCGRTKEINEIAERITGDKVKTLTIHGPKKIGKTRGIKKVLLHDSLKDMSCLYIDFDLVENISREDFLEFLEELCTRIGIARVNVNPCQKCQSCCKGSACSGVLKRIIANFTKLKEKWLLCFDNTDEIIKSDYGKEFLNFLQTITDKIKNIKLIIASTVRIHMTSKVKDTYFLDKMECSDLKELIIEVLSRSLDSAIVREFTNPEYPWLGAIAVLCDGIPRCAETLATILSEDDGLIKPVELVQLLLSNFLDTLNPQLFPEEDRPAQTYGKVLKKFTDEISEAYNETWLYEIADTMKGSDILPDEGLEAVRKEGAQVTSGTFKMDGLRRYIDYNILQKRKTDDQSLSMIRLYKHILCNVHRVVGEIEEDGLNLKTHIGEKGLKLVKEEAKRIGLDLDNVEEINALVVERELHRVDLLNRKGEQDKSSGEENDDDSGHSSFDDNDEHQKDNSKSLYSPTDNQEPKYLYRRYDSTSGPFAMSYKDPEDGLKEESIILNDVKQQINTPIPQLNQDIAIPDDAGGANTTSVGSEIEESFLRGSCKDGFQERATLSNSFPTTYLKTALQPVENTDLSTRQERHRSGHQICPTPLQRIGSEDYEHADIPNIYVHTTEASDGEKRRNPRKEDAKLQARYSSSSTDSGEIRLSLEIKNNVTEN